MRRFFLYFSLIALTCSLAYIFYDPHLPEKVEEYVFYEKPFAFTPKYEAEDILKAHRKILLKDKTDTFLPPNLYYLPCVLIDLKSKTPSGKIQRSTQIWSLTDGERILDLDQWLTTKGYGLIINLDATSDEIALLDELSTKKIAHSDKLYEKLSLQKDKFETTLRNSESKGLTKKQGEYIYLNKGPFILNIKDRPLSLPQLTNSSHFAGQFYKHFTKWDIQDLIKKIAKNAQIENIQEVFVPVWQIPVIKGNGQKISSYWNGLNGRLVATVEEKNES